LFHLLQPLIGEKKEVKIVANIELDRKEIESFLAKVDSSDLEKEDDKEKKLIEKLKNEIKHLDKQTQEKGDENEVKKNKIKISLTEEEELIVEHYNASQVADIITLTSLSELERKWIKEILEKGKNKVKETSLGLVNDIKDGHRKFFYLKKEYEGNEGERLYYDSRYAMGTVLKERKGKAEAKKMLEEEINDTRMERISSDKFTSDLNPPNVANIAKAGIGKLLHVVSQGTNKVLSSKRTGSNILRDFVVN